MGFTYFYRMNLMLIFKGMLMGFAVSVPMGPIGVLIVQRTVNKNKTSGFLSGVGATLSDALYAIIAGFSLTYIIDFISVHKLVLHVIGALALFLLGVHIYKKKPQHHGVPVKEERHSYFRDVISTFLMTFTNPMVIFTFLTVYAGFGAASMIDKPLSVALLVFGVIVGANLWWFLLTSVISAFRHKFDSKILLQFNKISGALIMFLVVVFLINTFIR